MEMHGQVLWHVYAADGTTRLDGDWFTPDCTPRYVREVFYWDREYFCAFYVRRAGDQTPFPPLDRIDLQDQLT